VGSSPDWRKAWEAAELEPITLHEGRHSHATDAGFAGLDDKSLANQLGHSSVIISKDRYGHVSDKSIQAAIAKR